MESDTLLQKQYKDAVAVREMMTTDGWKVLNRELDQQYATCVTKLIEKEDAEARTVLKGIASVRRTLEYIVSQGKKAHEQLNRGV